VVAARFPGFLGDHPSFSDTHVNREAWRRRTPPAGARAMAVPAALAKTEVATELPPKLDLTEGDIEDLFALR
jgi:hypothetical protein